MSIEKQLYDALRAIEQTNYKPGPAEIMAARDAMDAHEGLEPLKDKAVLAARFGTTDMFLNEIHDLGIPVISWTTDIDAADLFEGTKDIFAARDRVSKKVGVQLEVIYV